MADDSFEKRGGRGRRGLFLHGYDETVAEGSCDRCDHRLKDAYSVSYDGVRATHRICPRCWSHLKAAYGSHYHPSG